MPTSSQIQSSLSVEQSEGNTGHKSHELMQSSNRPSNLPNRVHSAPRPPITELTISQASTAVEHSVLSASNRTASQLRNKPEWRTRIYATACKYGKKKSELVIRVIAILAFIVAAVSLWPAISAAYDGRKAVRLAEWTASKDFLESCEAHDWKTPGCEKAKDMPLEPPPNFSRSGWKRWAWSPSYSRHNDSYHSDTERPIQLIAVSLLAFLVFVFVVQALLAPLHNLAFMLLAFVLYVSLAPFYNVSAASDDSDIKIETGILSEPSGYSSSYAPHSVSCKPNELKGASPRRNTTENAEPDLPETSDEEFRQVLKRARTGRRKRRTRVVRISKRTVGAGQVASDSDDEEAGRGYEDGPFKAHRIRRKLEDRRNNRFGGSTGVSVGSDALQGIAPLSRRLHRCRW